MRCGGWVGCGGLLLLMLRRLLGTLLHLRLPRLRLRLLLPVAAKVDGVTLDVFAPQGLQVCRGRWRQRGGGCLFGSLARPAL